MVLDPVPTSEQLRALRPAKPDRDPYRHQGWVFDTEPDGFGATAQAITVFLTGSECRFTCSMCDLWQYTLYGETPEGSLPVQIQNALSECRPTLPQALCQQRWLKLYNAANFFDRRNVPPNDLPSIAQLCSGMDRVIVENHAALFASRDVRESTLAFADSLDGQLEIAMGLETIDAGAMSRLNKRMTCEQFESACEFMRRHGIAIRAFVLLQPPGISPESAVDACVQACIAAWSWGVETCSIIPTRPGRGWLQSQQEQRLWQPPNAAQMEMAIDAAIDWLKDHRSRSSLTAGERQPVVLSDLWDWEGVVGTCDACREARRNRLHAIHLQQSPIAPWNCPTCIHH